MHRHSIRLPLVASMHAVPNRGPVTEHSVVVLFPLIYRLVSLKTSTGGPGIERGLAVMLPLRLRSAPLVLNELSSEPEGVAVLVDGLLAEVPLRPKIVLDVMVWHVEGIVESLTVRWLVRMGVSTVIELVVQRRIHVLRADQARLASRLGLLEHGVGWRELVVLHRFILLV